MQENNSRNGGGEGSIDSEVSSSGEDPSTLNKSGLRDES